MILLWKNGHISHLLIQSQVATSHIQLFLGPKLVVAGVQWVARFETHFRKGAITIADPLSKGRQFCETKTSNSEKMCPRVMACGQKLITTIKKTRELMAQQKRPAACLPCSNSL
jgi:hypothetical protein